MVLFLSENKFLLLADILGFLKYLIFVSCKYLYIISNINLTFL